MEEDKGDSLGQDDEKEDKIAEGDPGGAVGHCKYTVVDENRLQASTTCTFRHPPLHFRTHIGNQKVFV